MDSVGYSSGYRSICSKLVKPNQALDYHRHLHFTQADSTDRLDCSIWWRWSFHPWSLVSMGSVSWMGNWAAHYATRRSSSGQSHPWSWYRWGPCTSPEASRLWYWCPEPAAPTASSSSWSPSPFHRRSQSNLVFHSDSWGVLHRYRFSEYPVCRKYPGDAHVST